MCNTISSSDTLIIKSRMASGAVYTVELQQKARTDADIQQFIDTVVDARETVISVWRVECHEVNGIPLIVEDITERFDVRSIDEIEETAKRVSGSKLAFSHAARLEAYATAMGGRG